jgi:hypothetical protein
VSEDNAIGILLIVACIWFGYPLHSIAADLRWMRLQIKAKGDAK